MPPGYISIILRKNNFSQLWNFTIPFHRTVYSGYKGQVYKGHPVIRDRMIGTESLPFNVV